MNTNFKTINILVVVTLLLGFIACNESKTTKPFIVSEYNNPQPKPGFETLRPPKGFYSVYNLIIDSSGQIFFYQFMVGERGLCGTGLPKHPDNIPEYASLSPERIVAVPSNAVENFITSNVINKYGNRKFISISSMTDTIRSIGFDNIFRMVSDTSNHICFNIRLTTAEENTVLRFKKRDEFYDPKEIIWDTTQIFFYPDQRDNFKLKQIKNHNPQSKIANPK